MWSAVVVCALLALLVWSAVRSSDGWVVETDQGRVRGYPKHSFDPKHHVDHYQFFGIPYATVPKGSDKFKAPLDPPSWTDIFEATENNVACPQPNIQFGRETQKEDCLVINVFVPKTDERNLQVMAYVHGGAFFVGAGTMISHEALLRENVIIVNFNYRLGVHGFLCLGTEDVPGNAGMKDQVAALRWIKRNIARFGGNPEDVTVAGFSAGSASVEHLMLSPMAKGLFTKVIAESGSALSAWAATPDPIALAKRYMEETSGKSSDDVTELEKFYKSRTMEQLTERVYSYQPDTMFGFVPCVEPRIEGEESFYNESPIDILKKGDYDKVPFMPGFAREEGMYRLDMLDQWSVKMEHNFADFLPQDLVFRGEDEKKRVAAKVKKFYFKDAAVGVDTISAYVDYFTDVMFGYSIVRSARLHAMNSVPVYLYLYTYVPFSNYHEQHSDKFKGAKHCAQSFTLNTLNNNYSPNDEVKLMQSRLAKSWANFARFGNPVTTIGQLRGLWERMTPQRLNYLIIDLELQAKERILGDRVGLWDEIYEKHYREPISPTSAIAN